MSQAIMDLHWHVFLVLYSELDAKTEGQRADNIEEIDRFFRSFCNFCPTFPKPNGKRKKYHTSTERNAACLEDCFIFFRDTLSWKE